ncbi:MAG: type II toxin-antitoxin system PemK/MazF family toxin, partial [Pseudanabaena sp. ELA748]
MSNPITNTKRNFPFYVAIAGSKELTGYVMVEQVKSIDYKSRNVKLIEFDFYVLLNSNLPTYSKLPTLS